MDVSDIDRQWLEDLWSRYGGPVYAYAARRVGRQHADDVVADVFVVEELRRSARGEANGRTPPLWAELAQPRLLPDPPED